MKSALLVHYFFPPIRSAAVSRNYYFSLEFARTFDKVFVLTTSNQDLLEKEVLPLPSKLEVIKCYTVDYRTVLSYLSRQNHISENRKTSVFFKALIKLQKTLPFHFILGEGGLFYIISAYKQAIRKIKKEQISVIYSSFGPYADHLVAYYLKKRYPDIKWIADFRDLQVEPIYRNTFLNGWQRRIEKKILQRADLISTISNGLAKNLEKSYQRPVVSVNRGVNLRNYNQQKCLRFTICYTGSLYQDFRDASYFFHELSRLVQQNKSDDIQFLYAGKDGSQFKDWAHHFNLGSSFRDLGYLTRREIETIQNQSQIQLLLTSSSVELSGVLTGKLTEYMESGNPILVLINGTRDLEFEQFIDKANAGIVCYYPPLKENMLYNFLLDHYLYWKKTGKIKQTLNRHFVKENLSWEKQHNKLFSGLT